MTTDKSKNYAGLKKYTLQSGAAVFGVCAMDYAGMEVLEISPAVAESLPTGVSIGVALSSKIMEEIDGKPTKMYMYHYKQINYLLDKIGVLVTNYIQDRGYQAMPIPASQVVGEMRGHLSHRELAARAGLGWRGRNNLLVSPQLGSRLRLVSVLTDFPLKTDKPLKDGCGSCRMCVQACPAGAIHENRENFDLDTCFRKLVEFRSLLGIRHHICGVCVKACEPGKQ
jgi:epoxyqueuosine reductase